MLEQLLQENYEQLDLITENGARAGRLDLNQIEGLDDNGEVVTLWSVLKREYSPSAPFPPTLRKFVRMIRRGFLQMPGRAQAVNALLAQKYPDHLSEETKQELRRQLLQALPEVTPPFTYFLGENCFWYQPPEVTESIDEQAPSELEFSSDASPHPLQLTFKLSLPQQFAEAMVNHIEQALGEDSSTPKPVDSSQ